jgi:phosphoribosyl 1,2-cyclic phosphodiesterase
VPPQVTVDFWGVRGSCPCPTPENLRYGGNTASVVINAEGELPVMLDLGTGIRQYGRTQPVDGTFAATALLTHLHWDHVQGLPFFPPVDREGAKLDIWAPAQEGERLGDAFGRLMTPPFFPITYEELRGDIRWHDVADEDFAIPGGKVKARPVPHCGATAGYRVEIGGRSIAYISDHQAPEALDRVDESVLELCDGADLLIHDAQYTPEEFQARLTWGHCTVDYSVLVAREAGARHLVLFHHDPGHDDDTLDQLLEGAKRTAGRLGVEQVSSAYEGLSISL